jgi:hypothetical protein
VVELEMRDRLGSMRHYVPNIRVRVASYKLHRSGHTRIRIRKGGR